MGMAEEFWEDPDRVDRFAARDPDHRLVELVRRYPDPSRIKVLDLGCAAGRNTVLLARLGFQVHALDASRAMVERTAERLRAAVGEQAASGRVRLARMDDLSFCPAAAFDLVVALGVHHAARSRAEWDRAVDETARVLKPAGLLLFSQFAPGTDLTGAGITPVPGEEGVFEGLPAGRAVLLDAADVDAAFALRGLIPEAPTRTVVVELEVGRRASVNGLYRRV